MKIANITPGILPIPPNGWGAIEKIIWENHLNLQKLGHESIICYLNDVPPDADVVHIHVANLANEAHERGIPYYFTMHDHYSYMNGKNSIWFEQNMTAIRNAIRAFVPAKYLVDYFEGVPEYFSHGVNTEYFTPTPKEQHRLLCVGNNGYSNNSAADRKGFGFAIEAAKLLNLPITVAGPSNNKNYFESNPANYNKLTVLYDLNEEQLREVYKEHTIFIHPSELEAGHPNLTLLEALSCGLPVVGTLEDNNSLRGMVKIVRDVHSVAQGITDTIINYDEYKVQAREQAETLSWYNRTREMVEKYESDEVSMKKQLLKHYTTTKSLKLPPRSNHVFYSIDGPYFEILGGPDSRYKVSFIDKKTNSTVYDVEMGRNCWAKANQKYYVDWKVRVQNLSTNDVVEYNLDLTGKRVFISIESKSLGDTLAWIPYVEEFKKKHNCEVICSTFWNAMFKNEYPDIEFVEPGVTVGNLVAMYRIGLFYGEGNQIDNSMHPSYPLDQPMQKWATDILGLEYVEIRPRIKQPDISNEHSKQISIAIHGTAQAKYWNNPTGWQDVVDWLKEEGYSVKLLSNEQDGHMGNKHPIGIEQLPPSSIDVIIEELKKSKLFIGIGSGLSWLSWGLNVPTMLISGFSEELTEPSSCIRIGAPLGVCGGCFNRTRLDPSDWNWCPDHKGTHRQFECSRLITSKTVIERLKVALRTSKPRIQIKHMLTRPYEDREIQSVQSIQRLANYEGFTYEQIINKVYDELPPKEFCRRPEDIWDNNTPGETEPGLGKITGRHYGCYLAHTNAIKNIDENTFDYTLIFEADALISTDINEFVNMIYEACSISERDDVYFIGLANNQSISYQRVNEMFTKTGHTQDLAHAYLIPNRTKQWWLNRIQDSEWDVGDLWFNHVFCHHPKPRYTTNKVYSKQCDGFSLLDLTNKVW
jgi:autotransporter strand-loop-strand O-heptosyltransferase